MRRAQQIVATVAVAIAVSVCTGCAHQVSGSAIGAADGVAGTGRVVSEETADSAGTVDMAALEARVAGGPRDDVPAGFHRTGVIVQSGLGSFTVAVPAGYRSTWTPGKPSLEFVSEVQRRDPAWGAQASRITAADPARNNVRALLLDTDRKDVRMVVVTITARPPAGKDALMADARAQLRRSGARPIDLHPVVANGVDGIYAEFAQAGGVPDRATVAVWITDPHHAVQWGVNCDVPMAQRDQVRAECLRIASTFRPLPKVSGAAPSSAPDGI
ncbi:hypothetical protein ACQEVB_27350 [Pseudonocardia sp. CA-107938]|uniref:hypothetical protein n=1 Tax=Pseudonocardia sp. CA-107938 TaxID=3240021 RepID=UPI003D8BE05B